MAFHVRFETKDPDVAPSTNGMHWVRTDTGESWIAEGTSAVSDWVRFGGSSKSVTTGSFSAGDVDVTHDLETKDLASVQVIDGNDDPQDLNWTIKDSNNITVEFPEDLGASARVIVRS